MDRIIKAFFYSWEGFRAAFRDEVAFRQEIWVLLVLLPLVLLLPLSATTRAVMIMTHLLVPLVELLNSAIEAVVDMVTEERHPLAKKAKDYGSSAVFLTLILCAVSWLLALHEWLV